MSRAVLHSLRLVRSHSSQLLVFSAALLLRGLPEILSGQYPVGYDVIVGYVPSIERFPEPAVLTLFGWVWAPLCIFLLRALWEFSFGSTYFFLKLFAPVLYGFFAFTFYW